MIAPPVAALPQSPGKPKNITGAALLAGVSISDQYLIRGAKKGATLNGAIFRDVDLLRCGPLLKSYAAHHRNMTFERIRSLDAKPGGQGHGLVSLTGEVRGLHIRNVTCQSTATHDDVCGWIVLRGKDANDVGGDIVIERFDLDGMWSSTEYPNGDGISIERGYVAGVIRNGRINGCSDAGIDLKGPDWRIDEVTISGCRESLKLWDQGIHGRIVSDCTKAGHILVATDKPIVIERLEVTGNAPIIRFERPGGRVIVKSLSNPQNAPLSKLAKDCTVTVEATA